MLFNFAVHDTFLAHGVLDGREEESFLVAMVFLDTVMPCQTIADEIFRVGWLDTWSLLVDAVEASDEGIMA